MKVWDYFTTKKTYWDKIVELQNKAISLASQIEKMEQEATGLKESLEHERSANRSAQFLLNHNEDFQNMSEYIVDRVNNLLDKLLLSENVPEELKAINSEKIDGFVRDTVLRLFQDIDRKEEIKSLSRGESLALQEEVVSSMHQVIRTNARNKEFWQVRK